MRFTATQLVALVCGVLGGTSLPALGSAQVCGNGRIEGAEQCDRNRDHGGYDFFRDRDCRDFGFEHGTLDCAADCRSVITTGCYNGGITQLCGNNRVEPGEDCDKSSNCSGTCECDVPGIPICSNGCRQGTEECDGGTATNNSCVNCRWSFSCGNGRVEPAGTLPITPAEQCDDGAGNSDTLADACRTDCTNPRCGDNVIDSDEECDDGLANTNSPAVDDDACRPNCEGSGCGDGIIDPYWSEQCDDGPDNADTIDADCNTICLIPGCGNGYREPWELCDDGNTDFGDGCSANCDSDESCGNDVVDRDVGEQCDDGNTTSDDGCSADCQLESCGNGIPEPGEACDDGNEVDGDGCNATCTSDETCGNDVLDTFVGEECDDANLERGDGCNEFCGIERCGNAVIEGAEECDDGATDADDGCSGLCAFETGWNCTGEPSVCIPSVDGGPLDAGFDAAPPPDATADAGTEPEGGGGCGCAATARAESAWPIVLVFGWLFRRRRNNAS